MLQYQPKLYQICPSARHCRHIHSHRVGGGGGGITEKYRSLVFQFVSVKDSLVKC